MSQNLNILNASPRSIHPGIRDESTAQVPFTPEQVPQHCPLFLGQSPLGEEGVVLTSGADLMLTHGASVLDQRSKFYSHQTHGMKRCNDEGNMFFFGRMVHQDAKAASAVLYLEVIKDMALPYQRDASGGVVTTGGIKQTTGTIGTDEVEVFKFRWTVEALADGQDINNLSTQNGTMTSVIAGEVPLKYPVVAMRHANRGKGGENFGFNFYLPHEASESPGDSAVMEAYSSLIYRLRMMYRVNDRTSPGILDTALGAQYVDLPLGEDMFNELTNTNYSDVNALEAYESDIVGAVTRPAPLGDFVVYEDNVNLLQGLVAAQETVLKGETVEPRQVNLLSEFNVEGNDQYAIRITSDSSVFKASNVHYLKGGDDGNVDDATLNDLVESFIATKFDDPEYPLSDIAQFPFSDMYDTGFNMAAKSALLSVMGKRPDVFVSVCTQDLSLPVNDVNTEYSMGSALYSQARLIPESVQYGTPACRAAIFGQVGKVTANDHVKRPVYPLIMDIITKRSRFMGAGDGEMKSGFGYDEGTNRHVENFNVKSITQRWKPESSYMADWKSGINTVRMINRQEAFWPAIQSVMSNDTSVLNSDINMHICTDIIRRQHLTWAMLSGNASLTEEQFLAESIRILTDLTTNRYDERATIQIQAYKSLADAARGYSWTMNADVYLNNMQTVAMMNVTARRATDLAA